MPINFLFKLCFTTLYRSNILRFNANIEDQTICDYVFLNKLYGVKEAFPLLDLLSKLFHRLLVMLRNGCI